LNRQKSIAVKIPPGVDTGSRIRVAGQGEPGRDGGTSGDLFIIVKVAPHPFFARSGKNLLLEIPISISEAVIGSRIMVPTMDGQVKMTIPPGTSSRRIFRLAEKGFPDLKGGKRGDLLITVNIVAPSNISDSAKDLIREFDRLTALNPRQGHFE
jgi:DnaJ-class molecular chaperone